MYKKLELVNNRIIIPNEFQSFFQEEKLAMVDYNREKISIISNNELSNYLNKVSKYLTELLKQNIIDYKKYRCYLRTICTKYCFYLNKISNKRLLLPVKALEMLNIDNTIYLTDNKNHLELYKDILLN